MSAQAIQPGVTRGLVGSVMAATHSSPAAMADRAARQSRFIMWLTYLIITVAFINLCVMFVVDERSPTILFAVSSILHVFAALALTYHQQHFLRPILKAAKSRECDDIMDHAEREIHPS